MLAKATGMAGMRHGFVETKRRATSNMLELCSPGVSKPLMPQSCRNGDEETLGRLHEGVEVVGGVTSVNDPSRCQILYRETKRFKFNGNKIIPCKSMDRH